MDANSIVIVSLISPKEKIWGQLLTLDAAGVTVRGMDLELVRRLRPPSSGPGGAPCGPGSGFLPHAPG